MGAPSRSLVIDVCRYFDRWLAYRRGWERVPGIQAAVLHDGEVIWTGAHGMADVEQQAPMTDRHLFRIASHSKTYTATIVMRLVEQGRLRLDDPLSQWVPALADGPIGSVTVREALGHGGGITRDSADADFWDLHRPFPDRPTLLQMAADDGRVLARNERFKYSNVAYSLVGLVIEAVTGVTYAQAVADLVTGPLGLQDTGAEYEPARADEYAVGYTSLAYGSRRVPIEHVDTAAMAAATGFYGTASDVMRYAAAHCFGDDRLLSDDGKRLLQKTEWDVPGSGTQYGLGFIVATVGGRRLVGHSGGYPGHITRSMWDPTDKVGVSVLTNAIDGPAGGYAPAFFTLLALAQQSGDDVDADSVALQRFEGRFANTWGVSDLVALGNRLYQLSPMTPDPASDPVRLEVVDDVTLRIAETSGYRNPGESLRLDRDTDGTIRSVRLGGMSSFPLESMTAAVEQAERVRVGRPLLPRS